MAIEDLRRLKKAGQPFFLAMGYIRPHLAWVAPKKYWDLHDPAELPVLTGEQVTPGTPPYALANNSELSHYVDLIDFPRPWEEKTVSPEQARRMVHGYYACVSYVDAQIVRLLGALEEEGLAENTIVVLWSDHGWKLGEYRGWGKMTNYEIDTRVPLIISAPGVGTPGAQTDELAELLDLYPTLCDLAGVDTPDFVDGVSLAPTLAEPQRRVRQAAFSQYYRRHQGSQYMGYAIRSQTHRLVEWRDFHTGEVTARELYDHQTDALEKVKGTVEIDDWGRLVYTPAEVFEGTETFTYTISNNGGELTDVGTVTVHVGDTAQPAAGPIAPSPIPADPIIEAKTHESVPTAEVPTKTIATRTLPGRATVEMLPDEAEVAPQSTTSETPQPTLESAQPARGTLADLNLQVSVSAQCNGLCGFGSRAGH